MAQIIWNKRASNQFAKIQEYLFQEFGEDTVKQFTFRTFQVLELLLKYPQAGNLENKTKGIRGFVLHKHTTIYYKPQNSDIFILAVFDNRQNPKNKPV